MMSNRILPTVAAATIAVAACTACAHTRPHAAKITDMYSDMAMHDGDANSDEAFILFTNHGYHVVFQRSEGEPDIPVVVPANIHGDAIAFTLPTAVDPRGTFRGRIADDALEGRFDGSGQALRLKRKASYWQ